MDNQQTTPVWFITGCSTGLGRGLPRAVLGRGWRAAVTARDVHHVADLAEGREDRVLPQALDLGKPGQGTEAVRQAEERVGAVDVLVNNAGYGYLAAIEEGEDEEVRAMLETNLFGLIETTQAALLCALAAFETTRSREFRRELRAHQAH